MQGECAALFDQAHDAFDEYLIPKGAFIQKSTCAGGKLLRHAHHQFLVWAGDSLERSHWP